MSPTTPQARIAQQPFIISFYDPQLSQDDERKRDRNGRTLEDILQFSNDELEYHHDYIQYLFPLPERSPINPNAPVITQSVREAFLARTELRGELRRALERMLQFYGFEAKEKTEEDDMMEISPLLKSEFQGRAKDTWMTRFDHNHLRITRIIRCLRILGLESEAQTFLRALKDGDVDGVVSQRTWVFWERASTRPLHLAPEENDDHAEGVSWLKFE